MDGSAIFYSMACISLAQDVGMSIGIAQQITIAILASFVSIGAAPIPNSAYVYLVLVMDA